MIIRKVKIKEDKYVLLHSSNDDICMLNVVDKMINMVTSDH